VDRGVFKALTHKEADDCKGPVNYISMVEVFKTGLYATTPLSICMNSSMKQPAPSGVSLNDCLLKGPSHYSTYTDSAVKTETSEQKSVSNIFFFSENNLFNIIEYI
jgi:hypothetical protein